MDYRRSELEKGLVELGLEEADREIILKATAKERHLWRVTESTCAAWQYAREHAQDMPLDDRDHFARFVLLVDAAGLGGRGGWGGSGSSTRRILTSLGKGRWQATDGRAWRAAAIEAAIGDGTMAPVEVPAAWLQYLPEDWRETTRRRAVVWMSLKALGRSVPIEVLHGHWIPAGTLADWKSKEEG